MPSGLVQECRWRGDHFSLLTRQLTPGQEPQRALQPDQREPRVYTVSGELPAGRHELRVSFVNDASNPPVEDRNGLVAGASFASAASMPEEIELLTDPPILFAVNRGKGHVRDGHRELRLHPMRDICV